MKPIYKTALIGLAVAFAANRFFKTPQGKKVKEKLSTQARELYDEIKNEALKMKSFSQQKYNTLVEKMADEYGVAGDVKDFLVEHLKGQWEQFQEGLKKAKKIAKREY